MRFYETEGPGYLTDFFSQNAIQYQLIKVATAEGNAQALLTSAKAEAEANRMKQQTLTPLLIQLEYVQKWDGKLPVYGEVPQLFRTIQK